jgi:hypothetical protein
MVTWGTFSTPDELYSWVPFQNIILTGMGWITWGFNGFLSRFGNFIEWAVTEYGDISSVVTSFLVASLVFLGGTLLYSVVQKVKVTGYVGIPGFAKAKISID